MICSRDSTALSQFSISLSLVPSERKPQFQVTIITEPGRGLGLEWIQHEVSIAQFLPDVIDARISLELQPMISPRSDQHG